MFGAVSYALAGTDALQLIAGLKPEDNHAEALAPRLMSFLLGGLRAPLSETEAAATNSGAPRKAA